MARGRSPNRLTLGGPLRSRSNVASVRPCAGHGSATHFPSGSRRNASFGTLSPSVETGTPPADFLRDRVRHDLALRCGRRLGDSQSYRADDADLAVPVPN